MAVLGSLLRPLGNFAFDDPRVNTIAPLGDLFPAQLAKKCLTPRSKRYAKATIAFRQPAAENVVATREGETIHIDSCPLCRREHQRSDDKMGQRQGVQLLDPPLRAFAT